MRILRERSDAERDNVNDVRIVLVVGLALAGCSDGLSADEFDDAVLDARCAYYRRCGLAASVDDCRAFYARSSVDSPDVRTSLEAGRLVFDPERARRCVDSYAQLTCDTLPPDRAARDACAEVFTGTIAPGDACAFGEECASGACAREACPDACCAGVCVVPRPTPDVGEPCTSLCVDGAFCNVDAVCQALLPEGAACTGPECAAGLYCAGLATSGGGACTPLPRRGEACESPCAELGSVCWQGTCAALGLPGAPCGDAGACSLFYDCAPDSATCTALPTLGMSCSTTCADGAYCEQGACVDQKPDGESCVYGDECASHLCSAGACVAVARCL